MNKKIAYSCYVDNSRHFQLQALRFVYSLRSIGVDAADIFLAVNENCSQDFISVASDQLEVNVSCHSNFTKESKPANKWLQLNQEFESDYSHIVLNDCDKFYVSFDNKWAMDSVRACPFVPRPTYTIFTEIFDYFGFSTPRFYPDNPDRKSEDKDKRNYVNNHNGGMIIIPRAKLDILTERWKFYIDALLNKPELLKSNLRNLDQVAFACMMEELGEDINFLPRSLDIALGVRFVSEHLSSFINSKQLILHIHADEDEHGFLTTRSYTDTALVELAENINARYRLWLTENNLDDFVYGNKLEKTA